MANLRAAADGNRARRSSEYLAVAGDRVVADFATHVKTEGRVNVRMGAPKLQALFDDGSVPSSWQRCVQLAAASGRPVDDHWDESQGVHAIRRRAFEEWMDGGQSAHYGALAISRRWVPGYGRMAVTLARDDDSGDVYLPQNSAETLVDADGTVRVAEALSDATSPGDRHLLAAVKHAPHAALADRTGQGRLLCSKTDFVEAIFPLLEASDVVDVLVTRSWPRNWPMQGSAKRPF